MQKIDARLHQEAMDVLTEMARLGHSQAVGNWSVHDQHVQEGIDALDSGVESRIRAFISKARIAGWVPGYKPAPLELI